MAGIDIVGGVRADDSDVLDYNINIYNGIKIGSFQVQECEGIRVYKTSKWSVAQRQMPLEVHWCWNIDDNDLS